MSTNDFIIPMLDELNEDAQAEPEDADVQHLATPEEVGDGA